MKSRMFSFVTCQMKSLNDHTRHCNMKPLLFCFFLPALAGCSGAVKEKPAQETAKPDKRIAAMPVPARDTAKFVAPDTAEMMAALQKAFTDHQDLDTFYYADDRYGKAWGAWFCPYFVQIGHLFSARQIHAIVYYANDYDAGITIYLRENGKWQKIFSGPCGIRGPELKDWNNDGVPDISMDNGGTPDPGSNISVWLTDKSGKSIHPVDEMDDLRNPVLDSATHHVVAENMNNYGFTHGEYIFKNYKMELSEEYSIAFAGIGDDTLVKMTMKRPGERERELKCTRQKAYDLTPARFKDDAVNIIGPAGIKMH